MTKPIALACSALALCVGLLLAPAAQAAETGDGTSKMSSGDARINNGGMKKAKKHKSGMMNGGAMMKKDDTAPAQ